MQASHAGTEPIVRLLLLHGADVNATTPDGDTALYEGLAWSRITDDLLNAGASPDGPASSYYRPLISAVSLGNDARLKTLLRFGAHVKAKDANGHDALFFATLYRKRSYRKLLEEAAAHEH